MFVVLSWRCSTTFVRIRVKLIWICWFSRQVLPLARIRPISATIRRRGKRKPPPTSSRHFRAGPRPKNVHRCRPRSSRRRKPRIRRPDRRWRFRVPRKRLRPCHRRRPDRRPNRPFRPNPRSCSTWRRHRRRNCRSRTSARVWKRRSGCAPSRDSRRSASKKFANWNGSCSR